MRGTSFVPLLIRVRYIVSIHVPREGYVHPTPLLPLLEYPFQSTYPVRGTSVVVDGGSDIAIAFQSTYPVRGTSCVIFDIFHIRNVSIHVPREGYVYGIAAVFPQADVSIHVPREGYVPNARRRGRSRGGFQSTYPVRGTSA